MMKIPGEGFARLKQAVKESSPLRGPVSPGARPPIAVAELPVLTGRSAEILEQHKGLPSSLSTENKKVVLQDVFSQLAKLRLDRGHRDFARVEVLQDLAMSLFDHQSSELDCFVAASCLDKEFSSSAPVGLDKLMKSMGRVSAFLEPASPKWKQPREMARAFSAYFKDATHEGGKEAILQTYGQFLMSVAAEPKAMPEFIRVLQGIHNEMIAGLTASTGGLTPVFVKPKERENDPVRSLGSLGEIFDVEQGRMDRLDLLVVASQTDPSLRPMRELLIKMQSDQSAFLGKLAALPAAIKEMDGKASELRAKRKQLEAKEMDPSPLEQFKEKELQPFMNKVAEMASQIAVATLEVLPETFAKSLGLWSMCDSAKGTLGNEVGKQEIRTMFPKGLSHDQLNGTDEREKRSKKEIGRLAFDDAIIALTFHRFQKTADLMASVRCFFATPIPEVERAADVFRAMVAHLQTNGPAKVRAPASSDAQGSVSFKAGSANQTAFSEA